MISSDVNMHHRVIKKTNGVFFAPSGAIVTASLFYYVAESNTQGMHCNHSVNKKISMTR